MPGKPREPLWATSLADERPHEADVLPEPEQVPEEPSPPEGRRQDGRRRVPAPLVAAVVAIAAAAATLSDDEGWMTVRTVPSAWEDVRMSCRTARARDDEVTIEWFTCRAVGGGRLPPGIYRPPEARWTSDIDGRNALLNEIEISSEGELKGWAVYP